MIMVKPISIVLGIFVGCIILIASSITIGKITFTKKVHREITEILKQIKDTKPEMVTESDLEGLPDPVQRWMRHSKIIGKERILSVRLKQKGVFRAKKDQKWMPFEAEEYYTTNVPAYVWYATMHAAPFFSITGRDIYNEGKGNMLIKLMALITVADVSGPKMNQAALVRYLSEIIWFPTAVMSEYITWNSIDSHSAKATLDYQGTTASAVFFFSENGEFKNMITERYMENDGQFTLEKWSTPASEYGEFNGIKIPTKGEAVWHLDQGDFSYIRVEVTDIDYNNPSVY